MFVHLVKSCTAAKRRIPFDIFSFQKIAFPLGFFMLISFNNEGRRSFVSKVLVKPFNVAREQEDAMFPSIPNGYSCPEN